MKPITGEWIAKAEGDWRTAQREMQAVKEPNFDAVVFQAKQCPEKYLEARLVEGELDLPRTQDLGVLLSLAAPVAPVWESLRPQLNALTDMGIEVRYPGTAADAADATGAVAAAGEIRELVRKSFGLAE